MKNSETQSAFIKVEDLDFAFRTVQALDRINLELYAHEVTAFIGPSGCGKTTLLRCFNRMNELIEGAYIKNGKIFIGDVDIYQKDLVLTELRRRVGMVFQEPNAFPKSIYENIAYGLRLMGIKERTQIDASVEQCLQATGLWEEVKDRLNLNALSLSAGQLQRLCIARALAVKPEILLMDEPCSALDPIATAKIEELIHSLKQNYTIIIVTHNMQQAARVSDRTAFFYQGKLVEFNDTDSIFMNPKNSRTEAYITGRFG